MYSSVYISKLMFPRLRCNKLRHFVPLLVIMSNGNGSDKWHKMTRLIIIQIMNGYGIHNKNATNCKLRNV